MVVFFSSRSLLPTDQVISWYARLTVYGGFICPFKNAIGSRPSQRACSLTTFIPSGRCRRGDTDFSLRWSLIKSGFSRGLATNAWRTSSEVGRRERGIWQRRYWEHAIRNDADLERHIDYIHFNPVKHGYVARVCDWPHSSFGRYVARGVLPPDWGGDVEEATGAYGE
jgi:hypothetical protein